MTGETQWYQVVSALGAAVGGLAGAVGAIAAWRAASASRQTSRDALEALAVATAPMLDIDFDVRGLDHDQIDPTSRARWVAVIHNIGSFAATNVTFDARFKDGHHVRDDFERADAGPESPGHVVQLREIDPPPGGPSPAEAGERAILRYSDQRGTARYEHVYTFLARTHSDGTQTPLWTAVEMVERRRIS